MDRYVFVVISLANACVSICVDLKNFMRPSVGEDSLDFLAHS